jgi:hypothetical protein
MRFTLLFAVTLTLAIGCQTSPRVSSHIEMLNSEKRVLEDELYELEYDYEDALDEIDQLKSENARLRQIPGASSVAPTTRPSRRTESPKKSTSPNLDLAPPMIDEGMLTEPKIQLPDAKPNSKAAPPSRPAPMAPGVPMSFLEPSSSSNDEEPGDLTLSQPGRAPRPLSSVTSAPERLPLDPADPRITHIFLDPLLTGGSDFDRQPGDDGVVVALETRNHENRFVPLAGPISVVALDPTQDQEHSRIARWDLNAHDIEQVIRASSSDPGIRLRLPWPSGAPQNNRLQLFVRYETVDGRKLEASREIFVTLPGQFSQRWTPRSPGQTRILVANQNSIQAPKRPADPTADPLKDAPLPVQPASHTDSVDAALDQSSPSAEVPPIKSRQWQPQR